MKPIEDIVKEKPLVGWLIFTATVVIVFLLGMLASSIIERRAEAVFAYSPEINFSQNEPRNSVWGEMFPREYDSYMKTAETGFRSKYNGSVMVDMLEESPRMVVLWAGYLFSRDYNQGRGHYYAVEDARNTLRTGGVPSPQPNTCWTCKSPDVPRVMEKEGAAGFYSGTWDTKGSEIVNSIGCADCHMPFISEGGQKFTDHHLQSPLNNVANSCQVCHREETERLIQDVYSRQDRIIENRNILETLLVRCHVEAKTAWDKGAERPQMKDILDDIRHAQWRWDLSAAGHGNSFHSPVETGRIISGGIALAQDARVKLARLLASLGHNQEIPYPDISTKDKAQSFIGLDMKKHKEEKRLFKENIIPLWIKEGEAREVRGEW